MDDAFLDFPTAAPKFKEFVELLEKHGLTAIRIHGRERSLLVEQCLHVAEGRYEVSYDFPFAYDLAQDVFIEVDDKERVFHIAFGRPQFGTTWAAEIVFELMSRFGYALLDLSFKEIYLSQGHNWAPPMDLKDRLAEAFPGGVRMIQLAAELL